MNLEELYRSFSTDAEVRELLMQSLEVLQCRDKLAAVQGVVPQLRICAERGSLYFTKLPEPPPKSAGEYAYKHSGTDLLRAMAQLVARGAAPTEMNRSVPSVPSRINYSVRDKSRQLIERLRNGGATLRELYAECASRAEIVATFISVLELCGLGSLKLRRRGKGYSVEFVGGSVDEIIEKIAE